MNSFGQLFKISIFGTSHGDSIGILIDGVPAGLKLDKDDFFEDLSRRKPNKVGQTARKESDNPIIEAGIFNGYTTGAPLLIRFLNENTISKDYKNLVNHPRPGHADFTAKVKYNGYNDYRGGGAFSGRLTAAIVAAGVVAKKLTNYEYKTELLMLGDLDDLSKKDEYLAKISSKGDSVGGVLRITVKNVPIGLGEPYFYSTESAISQILYSIGAVKGVSFGDGFAGCDLLGSEFNDPIIDEEGHTSSNHNGGINGGITNGNDLIINIFIKPTPSIYKTQETYNFDDGKVSSLQINGRHDSAIIERAMVVCENAIAIALCDLMMLNKHSVL